MAVDDEASWFSLTPDPANPGWLIYSILDQTRFGGVIGGLGVRRDGDRGIVRLRPRQGLSNRLGKLHGGAMMGFLDMAIFAAARILDCGGAPEGLTVELNVQFVGAADIDRPIDAIVEVSRETPRLIFLRGTVEQGDDIISSFMAIIRKRTR